MGLLFERLRAQNSAGAPINGAKLYTYIAGTTTNKATYSNKGLTVANANPILAPSDGWYPTIYGLEDADYKLVLKDASDVTIWTQDNYPAQGLVSNLGTRIKQIASNPLDYGAIGDGIADESAAVQSAVTDAVRTVDLLGKTYRCDTQISIPSNREIINGTLDFTNCLATDGYLRSSGTKGVATNLTANGNWKDTSVAVTSASGFATGDLCSLDSADVYSHASGAKRGEIVMIRSIAGTTFTVDAPLEDTYTTASTAKIAKLTTIDDVSLRNLILIANSGAAGSVRCIQAITARRLRISSCVVRGVKFIGIALNGCVDVVVEDCEIDNGPSSSCAAFGIEDACTNVTIRRCVARRLASFVGSVSISYGGVNAARGPRRWTLIEDCQFFSTYSAGTFNGDVGLTFGDAQHTTIRRCSSITAASASSLMTIPGVDCEIADNVFVDALSTADAITDGDLAKPARTGWTYINKVHGNYAYMPAATAPPLFPVASATLLAYDNLELPDAGATVSGPHIARVAVSKVQIVGTDAGDLGHADGVQLVAAVAGKIIEPLWVAINFTYSTAAYTTGGNVSAKYLGGEDATGVTTAAESFGAGASNKQILRPLTGAALVNTALVLVSAAGFTDPGTAAGTAVVTVAYNLL